VAHYPARLITDNPVRPANPGFWLRRRQPIGKA
jgi:hypothetical protein